MADEFCPDIVFTDLIMPMVSGEQLCRILRDSKKHEKVFIVVLSAIIIEDRDRILREVQCDICIAKGNLQVIRQELQGALQSYRDRKNQRPKDEVKAARIADGLKPSGMTRELLWEKRHFAQIMASLEEGIIEINPQGKIISANRSALEILGCREEALVGRALDEIVPWGAHRSAVERWIEQQLIGLALGKLEILEDDPLLIGDRTLTASLLPIDEEGSTFGLCILHDISRQYRAELHSREMDEALKLIKKMDAMSCMAGGFAHDFNNLLTVICGNLDIVATHAEMQSREERSRLLNQAKKAALVAVDLTRQISCFSHFGIMHRERVEIDRLVGKVLSDFFADRAESYALEVHCPGAAVQADPRELTQAIVNVLQNAVESSGPTTGPIVAVRLDTVRFADPQLLSGQYVPTGEYLRADISDFGKGIEHDRLFLVFDPYYSTKERGAMKGMGLGLTLVYAILRNHGGYVVVSSRPELGTTVSLFLPLAGEAAAEPADKGSSTPADQRWVLLLEPDRQMAEICQVMLGYLGFSVKVVGDREEAVARIRECTDDPQLSRPLVIIALGDPQEDSAVETCRLLHEIDPELKIIATSGAILDPVMEKYRDYGFVQAIPKPFSIETLKHIIVRVLDR